MFYFIIKNKQSRHFERQKDADRSGGWKELGGVEVGKTISRMYSMRKKTILNKKIKKNIDTQISFLYKLQESAEGAFMLDLS